MADSKEIVDAFKRIFGELVAKPTRGSVKYPDARGVGSEEIERIVAWLEKSLKDPGTAEEGLRELLGVF